MLLQLQPDVLAILRCMTDVPFLKRRSSKVKPHSMLPYQPLGARHCRTITVHRKEDPTLTICACICVSILFNKTLESDLLPLDSPQVCFARAASAMISRVDLNLQPPLGSACMLPPFPGCPPNLQAQRAPSFQSASHSTFTPTLLEAQGNRLWQQCLHIAAKRWHLSARLHQFGTCSSSQKWHMLRVGKSPNPM